MAYYLLQVTYAPEAWAALVDEPQNRTEAVQPAVELLGGTVHSTWLVFGEYDVVSVFKLPDNIRAAAISMAISAGGAVKAIKTTPLMTWEVGAEAMRAAAQVTYQPPIGVFRSVEEKTGSSGLSDSRTSEQASERGTCHGRATPWTLLRTGVGGGPRGGHQGVNPGLSRRWRTQRVAPRRGVGRAGRERLDPLLGHLSSRLR